jgi:hypothetical protein
MTSAGQSMEYQMQQWYHRQQFSLLHQHDSSSMLQQCDPTMTLVRILTTCSIQ